MLEIDLKNYLETLHICDVYPITITEDAPYPVVVYEEINNKRNRYSSLQDDNLRDQSFRITYISKDSEWVFTNKDLLIRKLEMFSGVIGNTKIFTTNIDNVVSEFDNKQRIYIYNVELTITKHKEKPNGGS